MGGLPGGGTAVPAATIASRSVEICGVDPSVNPGCCCCVVGRADCGGCCGCGGWFCCCCILGNGARCLFSPGDAPPVLEEATAFCASNCSCKNLADADSAATCEDCCCCCAGGGCTGDAVFVVVVGIVDGMDTLNVDGSGCCCCCCWTG